MALKTDLDRMTPFAPCSLASTTSSTVASLVQPSKSKATRSPMPLTISGTLARCRTQSRSLQRKFASMYENCAPETDSAAPSSALK
jgi:hypothetical protein